MILKLKQITPAGNGIITTADKYEDIVKNGNLIDADKVQGTLKEWQTITAVGPYVRDYKVGDVIFIKPDRYAQKQYAEDSMKNGIIKSNPTVSFNFPMIILNGVDHLKLFDSDIDFKIDEYELEEEPIQPELILPAKELIN